MKKDYLLKDVEKIKKLAERLANLETVSGQQKMSIEKSWEIVHALSEFEEIYTDFLHVKLPHLTDAHVTDEELKDLTMELSLDAQHLKILLKNFD